MERRLQNWIGYTVHAPEGDFGKVIDILFDDEAWVVKSIVIQTGDWLDKRPVVVSAGFFEYPDHGRKLVQADLNRKDFEFIPEPIEAHDAHGAAARTEAPPVGAHAGYMGSEAYPHVAPTVTHRGAVRHNENIHLHSFLAAKKLKGKMPPADHIGTVKDFHMGENWKIEALDLVAADWTSIEQLAVPTDLVKKVHWNTDTMVLKTDIAHAGAGGIWGPESEDRKRFEDVVRKVQEEFGDRLES
jgi:hypothetical protein